MITVNDAIRILHLRDRDDYAVNDIFCNGFKATRLNEWCKTEIYCEVFKEPEDINADNVYTETSVAVLVVKRYK